MDMGMDMDSRNAFSSRLSRGIILLGDSGGFLSRHGDSEMSDRIDENHDLEARMLANDEESEERSRREETPAPETQSEEGSADVLQPKTHVPSPSKEKATEPVEKKSEDAHVEG